MSVTNDLHLKIGTDTGGAEGDIRDHSGAVDDLGDSGTRASGAP